MAAAKSEVVIYHNPSCTTSRKVLGMIREAGVEPRVIEYLKTPPSRAELLDLLRRMGLTPRQLLRRRGTPYDELGLGDPARTDDALIDAVMAHPILMERPVVVGPRGARLCRPPERVREVLPAR
jgi:arsenate reductase